MPSPAVRITRRVWFAVLGGLTVAAVWWGWSRQRPPAAAAATTPVRPFVRLGGAGAGADDRTLREQAKLFDPTPLFFPTEWNYGQQALPENLRRQPGQVFGSFEPKYSFTDPSLKPYGVEAAPAPENLSDVLVQGNEAPLAGFGQVDRPQTALTERKGFLEVRRLNAMQPILERTLTGFDPPRTDYGPMEFLVVVGSAGIIGDPILASGSGWEEVDNFFRTYLVKAFHLGERLDPGRYRVSVGP